MGSSVMMPICESALLDLRPKDIALLALEENEGFGLWDELEDCEGGGLGLLAPEVV